MIYQVTHKTVYEYQTPAVFSQHLMRLRPRQMPGQQIHSSSIAITPEPDNLRVETDMFGNAAHVATITRSHPSIEIVSTSRVERSDPSSMIFEASAAWEEVRDAATGLTVRPVPVEISPHCFPSRMTASSDAIEAYTRESFMPGRPILAAASEMTRRIFEDFDYVPGATSSDTLPVESFGKMRGVCQDFAHVMLAGLRALRLPARYVSGYLRTTPPEGQVRMVGADASHAWVSVWDPVFGWVDFDPTNNIVPGLDHITLAWARDFADVSPVSGVVIGAGQQVLSVGVDVAPMGPESDRKGMMQGQTQGYTQGQGRQR